MVFTDLEGSKFFIAGVFFSEARIWRAFLDQLAW